MTLGIMAGVVFTPILCKRLLSGVDVPWRGLRSAALIGGIGLTVLKALGTTLLGAMNNPLFASIALVVGPLVWLNYMSRIVLLASAWAANHLDEQQSVALTPGVQDKLAEGPPAADAAQVEAAAGSLAPVRDPAAYLSGAEQRAVDRASIVAGAVVGAGATAAFGAVAGTWRRLRRRQ